MRVYNTWREVKLSTSLTQTIVQNTSGLTLLVKYSATEPVDDDNALYYATRKGIFPQMIYYNHDKDKMWVRVLEPFEDGEVYPCSDTSGEIRRYITVINDEEPYNGFEIRHGAGLMDFSITNATYVFWELADGTTSTSPNPSVVLPEGISILYADFYKGNIRLDDGLTNANYIGNLKDLPQLNYYLKLQSTGTTGDLKDLPNILFYLSLSDCLLITGDLKDLPNIGDFLNLFSCQLITGSLNPTETLNKIYLQGTGMTPNNTDQTIINLKNVTTVTSGGILQIKANRTSASDEAFNYLSANGWTITEI